MVGDAIVGAPVVGSAMPVMPAVSNMLHASLADTLQAVALNYTNAQKKGYVAVAGGVHLRRPRQCIPLRREGRDSEELDPGRFQCQH